MIKFKENCDLDAMVKWANIYNNEVITYPMWNFSKVDPTFKMKTCVDVGGNLGGISLRAAKYFENVIYIEPCKATFTKAVLNIISTKTDNVEPYNLAVGKRSGDIVDISFDKSEEYSGNCSTAIDKGASSSKEKVMTIDLDSIFLLAETEHIDYMKIDCEGAEYDFLIGQDLSTIGIIAMELHVDMPSNFRKLSLLTQIENDFHICGTKKDLDSTTNIVATNKKYGRLGCPACQIPPASSIEKEDIFFYGTAGMYSYPFVEGDEESKEVIEYMKDNSPHA